MFDSAINTSPLRLVHDGYRCVITGAVDFASAEQHLNQLAAMSVAHGVRMTNCAHILAPSTSQDISSDKTDGPTVDFLLPLQVHQLIYSVRDAARIRRICMGRHVLYGGQPCC